MDPGLYRVWNAGRYECCCLLRFWIDPCLVRINCSYYGNSYYLRVNAYVRSSRGVIGPYLVSHGLAFGKEAASPDGLVSYFSLSAEFADAQHPSPRYWLLWPGVVCMIAAAFTGRASASSLSELPP